MLQIALLLGALRAAGGASTNLSELAARLEHRTPPGVKDALRRLEVHGRAWALWRDDLDLAALAAERAALARLRDPAARAPFACANASAATAAGGAATAWARPAPRNASEHASVPGSIPAAETSFETRSRMCSNLFFPRLMPPYARVTTHATPTASSALSSARMDAPPRVSPSSSKNVSVIGFFLAVGFLFSSPRPVPRFGTRHALMAWSTTSPAHARFSADNAAFASASVETGNARWATKTLPRSVTGRERKKRTVLPAKRPPSASEPREWTWHSASAMSPAEVKDSGRRVRDDSETRGEVCWHVPAISRVIRLV